MMLQDVALRILVGLCAGQGTVGKDKVPDEVQDNVVELSLSLARKFQAKFQPQPVR